MTLRVKSILYCAMLFFRRNECCGESCGSHGHLCRLQGVSYPRGKEIIIIIIIIYLATLEEVQDIYIYIYIDVACRDRVIKEWWMEANTSWKLTGVVCPTSCKRLMR